MRSRRAELPTLVADGVEARRDHFGIEGRLVPDISTVASQHRRRPTISPSRSDHPLATGHSLAAVGHAELEASRPGNETLEEGEDDGLADLVAVERLMAAREEVAGQPSLTLGWR